MTAFPESESMTIKRIEVALRNKDRQLLKEAAYKLHEKYHTGYEFKMLDELVEIGAYIENSNIPDDIKGILCPTIEEILSVAGKEVTEYHKEDEDSSESNQQNEVLKRNYAYNFGDTTTDAIQEQEDSSGEYKENTSSEISDNIIDIKDDEVQSEAIAKKDDVVSGYKPINEENKTEEYVNYSDNLDDKILENIAIFYHPQYQKDSLYELKTYRQELNAVKSSVSCDKNFNILKTLSSLDNKINVQDDICEFLCTMSKFPKKQTLITSSQNKNLTKYLSKNGVKFKIPMVQSTYGENCNLDIIPLYGAYNLFACSKCGSLFIDTESSLLNLALKCSDCENIAYPDLYDVNSIECNSIFWHRAFGALMESDVWVLINPPFAKECEVIEDFLKVAIKSAKPKRVYVYSTGSIYDDVIKEISPKTKVFANFDTLEYLLLDFANQEGC